MHASDIIAIASAVLSLIAIITSILLARAQFARAGRERLQPLVREVLRDSLSPEFRSSRDYVEEQLRTEHPDSTAGLRGLPNDVRERVRPVMGYFNMLGLPVANETVDSILVASTMGGSVVETWKAVAPYVYTERVLRGHDPNYYGNFEHLAKVVDSVGRGRLEMVLHLEKWPPAAPAT